MAILKVFSFYLATVICLEVIQQPDDVLFGSYDNFDHNITHMCTRACKKGAPPKVCYYKFIMEAYIVLGAACQNCPKNRSDCYNEQCVTADGVAKPILTINRRIPGPSIQVCTGDTIVVDVVNRMKARSVTMHWHGVHQKKTPFMDGVPMVTQCPILEDQRFRYKFLAEQPGTNFYHSHSGLQKMDGISGNLIIRSPSKKRYPYDFDLPSHVIHIQDWMHNMAEERQPGLLHKLGQKPDSYLINGKGIFKPKMGDDLSQKTPITQFRVQKGKRYRFRIIGSTSLTCSIEVSFESHQMMVLASDERDLVPAIYDKIILTSGERYDVVIKADKKPKTYWIIVKGCYESLYQIAALAYVSNESEPVVLPSLDSLFPLLITKPKAVILNLHNSNLTYVEPYGRSISQMQSREPTPNAILKTKPDLRFTFSFGLVVHNESKLFTTNPYISFMVPISGVHISMWMNNIILLKPPSPLLTQRKDIPRDTYCTHKCMQAKMPCECLRIVKVPLNSVVEIIIADLSFFPLSHPFHLHGHVFHVLTEGTYGSDYNVTLQDLYKQLDAVVFLHSKLPVKDTIMVPAFGYTVFRVLFDNPGYWLLHCNFLFHLENGMSSVIQVGEENDLPPIPKGFPTCGEFIPNI